MHKQKRGCFHEKITKNGFCQKILSVKTENFLLFFNRKNLYCKLATNRINWGKIRLTIKMAGAIVELKLIEALNNETLNRRFVRRK